MTKTKIFFENLDGLRAICFLSVFFYHSFHTESIEILDATLYRFIKRDLFGNGFLGVNFFFVLSGYLITYLLIEEERLAGGINLLKFWMRRILRIWPLFYFCVFFGFVVFPFLKTWLGQVPNETADVRLYLTFLNNFDVLSKGLPDASILGVLWSIAVEEQFYFFWPIALLLVPVKRQWVLFVGVVLASILFRTVVTEPIYHKFHTLSCIGDLSVGAFMAWMVQVKRFDRFIATLKKGEITLIYVAALGYYFFLDDLERIIPASIAFNPTFIAILFSFIILEQSYGKHSLFKMKNARVLSNLGRISYGLYCLHFIGILVAVHFSKIIGISNRLWVVLVLETALALGLTWIVAYLSYRFYEKPFLRMKEKYSTIH